MRHLTLPLLVAPLLWACAGAAATPQAPTVVDTVRAPTLHMLVGGIT